MLLYSLPLKEVVKVPSSTAKIIGGSIDLDMANLIVM